MNSVQSSSLVKSSFFDEVYLGDDQANGLNHPISDTPLWDKKFKSSELLDKHFYVSKEVIHEDYLLRKSQKRQGVKPRYFILFKDRLESYENDKKEKFKGCMLLKGAKVETLDNTLDEKLKHNHERFCLIFTQNKKFIILYAKSKEQLETWFEKLKLNCVLSYYGKFYANIKIIGKGTFAKVIHSKRILDNLEFAVKTFDKKSIIQSKTANRTRIGLINEINLMRILDHPSIIKLYEVYEGEHHIYLVLELLRGGELFDRIMKRGQYLEEEAAIMISKILSALKYIHSLGIMHRDLKPENLIVKDEDDFDIRLADFGLAEFEGKQDLLFRRCGTPGYVAPEILNDQPYNTKCDVFSAGVILYILLTGCSPFYGKNYNEILTKNKLCDISFDFASMNIKISGEARDLLIKLLQKDQSKRISAHDALEHIWIKANLKARSSGQKAGKEILAPSENLKKLKEQSFILNSEKQKDLISQTPMMTSRLLPHSKISDKMDGSPTMTKSCSSRIVEKDGKMRGLSENEDDFEDIPQDDSHKIQITSNKEYKPSPRQKGNEAVKSMVASSTIGNSHTLGSYEPSQFFENKGEKAEEKNVRAISKLLKDMEK